MRKSDMVPKLQKLYFLVGSRVARLFLITIFIGIFWFLIEISFVYILQGFLASIGFVARANTNIPDWFPSSFDAALLLLLAFGVFRGLVFMGKLHLAQVISQAFTRSQRERLISYALTKGHLVNTHEIVILFGDVVNQVGSMMMNLSSLIVTVLAGLLLLGFGIKTAPYEMVLGVTLLALAIFPLRILNRQLTSYAHLVFEESKSVNYILLTGLKNFFFLRIYNLGESEARQGREKLARQEAYSLRYSWFAAQGQALPLMLGILVISIVSYVSHYWIGTKAFVIISFFYVFIRMAQSASEASGLWHLIKQCFPGLRTLYAWNERMRTAVGKTPVQTLSGIEVAPFLESLRVRGLEIQCQELAYSYEDGPAVFRDLSFEVNAGDSLVIKGESGAGKSTLIQVILGLAEPTKGTVRLNGLDSSKVSELLGPSLGYVGPEPFLLPGTLRQNLLYGHPSPESVSEESIWSALERAQIASLVQGLPGKLDFLFYESAQISTGQKQRLGIARAFLRDPKLLVLDEATANLDPESEAKILREIAEMKGRVTIVAITHKSSFDFLATRILSLKAR